MKLFYGGIGSFFCIGAVGKVTLSGILNVVSFFSYSTTNPLATLYKLITIGAFFYDFIFFCDKLLFFYIINGHQIL